MTQDALESPPESQKANPRCEQLSTDRIIQTTSSELDTPAVSMESDEGLSTPEPEPRHDYATGSDVVERHTGETFSPVARRRPRKAAAPRSIRNDSISKHKRQERSRWEYERSRLDPAYEALCPDLFPDENGVVVAEEMSRDHSIRGWASFLVTSVSIWTEKGLSWLREWLPEEMTREDGELSSSEELRTQGNSTTYPTSVVSVVRGLILRAKTPRRRRSSRRRRAHSRLKGSGVPPRRRGGTPYLSTTGSQNQTRGRPKGTQLQTDNFLRDFDRLGRVDSTEPTIPPDQGRSGPERPFADDHLYDP